MDLILDEDGEYVLGDSAGYSYQKLTIRKRSNKTLVKPVIAICNDYGYSVIGSNGSLKIILIATHEMIHRLV